MSPSLYKAQWCQPKCGPHVYVCPCLAILGACSSTNISAGSYHHFDIAIHHCRRVEAGNVNTLTIHHHSLAIAPVSTTDSIAIDLAVKWCLMNSLPLYEYLQANTNPYIMSSVAKSKKGKTRFWQILRIYWLGAHLDALGHIHSVYLISLLEIYWSHRKGFQYDLFEWKWSLVATLRQARLNPTSAFMQCGHRSTIYN